MTSLDDCKMEILQEKFLQQGQALLNEKMDAILKDPVIKKFRENEEYNELFNNAVNTPNTDTLNELNKAFVKFNRTNRIIRYCAGFIRQYSIDYDKRIRLNKGRTDLVSSNTFEVSPVIETSNFYDNNSRSVEEEVLRREQASRGLIFSRNETLNSIMEVLDDKPKRILLLLDEGYSNREIAKMFGESEQNIHYWMKKAVKQLKEELK